MFHGCSLKPPHRFLLSLTLPGRRSIALSYHPPPFSTSRHSLTPLHCPLTSSRCPSTPPHCSSTPHHCLLTPFSRPIAPLSDSSPPFNASPLSFNASLSPFSTSPLTCYSLFIASQSPFNAFSLSDHFTLIMFNN